MEKRIRTVNTAFEEIKAKDPNSAITKTAIRRLLSNGTIPSINIGNKVIFNMDDLENILAEVG
ncbi:MAG: helix-turn-helix domain-containing protein [Clostridia bacterium]|nr:helix-turn-helix domain-containing protein [Clostridia bacterium]